MQSFIPDNPLTFIQYCVWHQKIYWTYHSNMRMKERKISRTAIIDSVDRYEIIEEYPEDKYFPSYLIYSVYQEMIFHILFATDIVGIMSGLLLHICPILMNGMNI